MRRGPSPVLVNRHLKRAEREILKRDMNNLYSWSMSQCLATGYFHRIDFIKRNGGDSIKTFLGTPDNNKCGYSLECELENPSNIHEKTKQFPFLPDRNTIKVDCFSPVKNGK